MKFFGVVVCIVSIACFQAAAMADVQFSYNGKDYELITTIHTWADARADAQSRSDATRRADLAIINSAGENQAIFNVIQANITGPWESRPFNGGGARYAWIGATDDPASNIAGASEDNFFWVDGTALATSAYTNFGIGEPDNFNSQNHVAMGVDAWPVSTPGALGDAGQWNDLDGVNNTLYYVVEYDAVPEPATMAMLAAGGVMLLRKRKQRTAK